MPTKKPALPDLSGDCLGELTRDAIAAWKAEEKLTKEQFPVGPLSFRKPATESNGPGEVIAPKPQQDLPTRLGLKPYSVFEKEVGPLLKRLDQEERNRILMQIYSLARMKLVMDFQKKQFKEDLQSIEAELKKSIPATLKALGNAITQLKVMQDHIGKSSPSDSSNIQSILEFLEKLRLKYVNRTRTIVSLAEQFRNLEGTTIAAALRGDEVWTKIGVIDARDSDEFEFAFPGPQVMAADYWFIKALEECFPPAPTGGKRSRFGRAEIMEKVFTFIRQQRSLSRFSKVRTKQNRRTKN